jgi:hypothetical protein
MNGMSWKISVRKARDGLSTGGSPKLSSRCAARKLSSAQLMYIRSSSMNRHGKGSLSISPTAVRMSFGSMLRQ